MADPLIAAVFSVNYAALLKQFLWINFAIIIAKVLRGCSILNFIVQLFLLQLKCLPLSLRFVDLQCSTL